MEAANGLRGLVYCVWIEAVTKAVLLLLTLRQCLSIALGVNTKAAVVHTHNCPKSIPYTSTLIYKIDPQNLICKKTFFNWFMLQGHLNAVSIIEHGWVKHNTTLLRLFRVSDFQQMLFKQTKQENIATFKHSTVCIQQPCKTG